MSERVTTVTVSIKGRRGARSGAAQVIEMEVGNAVRRLLGVSGIEGIEIEVSECIEDRLEVALKQRKGCER